MDEQPTVSQIVAAVTELSIVFNIPGARSEALRDLLALRKAKTTWVGKEENDLRLKLDAVLDDCTPGWRERMTHET